MQDALRKVVRGVGGFTHADFRAFHNISKARAGAGVRGSRGKGATRHVQGQEHGRQQRRGDSRGAGSRGGGRQPGAAEGGAVGDQRQLVSPPSLEHGCLCTVNLLLMK